MGKLSALAFGGSVRRALATLEIGGFYYVAKIRAFFPFYPADWLADPNVRAMTLEQQGAYINLLATAWVGGPLPDDVGELAKLTGADPQHFIAEIWPKLSGCWHQNGAGLVNRRLEEERAKALDLYERRRRGGQARARQMHQTSLHLEGTSKKEPGQAEGTSEGPSPATTPDATPQPVEPNGDARTAVATQLEDSSSKSPSPSPPPKDNTLGRSGGSSGPLLYDDDFEDLWSRYPKRSGGNPKREAWKAWRTRRGAGVAQAELVEAVDNYRAFVRSTGKEGTEHVMQARTFLGPNERWTEWRQPPEPLHECDNCGASYPAKDMHDLEERLCRSCKFKSEPPSPLVQELMDSAARGEPAKMSELLRKPGAGSHVD